MSTIQDGETHGEDVAQDGYISRWADAAGLNATKPAALVAASQPLAPGRWQTGDVHGDDLNRIVAEAPLWGKTGP